MEINLGGKDYELAFGLDFIASLDKTYEQEMGGMKFGLGVETAIPLIKMQNPTVLVSIIKAGTSHMNTKPSNKGVNDFLTDLAVEDKLDAFFNDIESEMSVAPFLKGKMKSVETNVKQMEAAEKRKLKAAK